MRSVSSKITPTLRRLARRSKTSIVLYKIYNNWKLRNRYRAGDVQASYGSTHETKTVEESLHYIEHQFADYLSYSGLTEERVQGMRILELGFGDNLGVALKFMAAGAAKVVCVDKFYAKHDLIRERNIYEALRSSLDTEAQQRFDKIVTLDEEVQINNDSLTCISGVNLDDWAHRLTNQEQRFDLIISRAVIEEIYDPKSVFLTADRFLRPGGQSVHKIDMSDYGVFSGAGLHPLTFLTIPESIYHLMASDSAMPNRKLRNYYAQLMNDLGYETTFFVTRIIGGPDLIPYRQEIKPGVDYTDVELALVEEIRPQLEIPYKALPGEDLMVQGVFLVARKPDGQESN